MYGRPVNLGVKFCAHWIGARAVVATDVPPYAVYAGNPARLVKYRFTDQIIEKLMRLKWWDWSFERTSMYLTELTSEPTDQLLDELLSVSERGVD